MASNYLITLFLQCLLLYPAMSKRNITTTDQSAVLQFKTKVIDPHNFLQKWEANNSVCEWPGITCSTLHQRVISLNVSYMGLIGNVPPGLGNLSFLKSLNLRGNNFTGILPEDLVHLRRLRVLDVGFNQFMGNLPLWLFSMSKIESLFLFFNNLTNLKLLRIGNNFLEGRIPRELGNLENLFELDLQNNKLTGDIQSIYNISTLEIRSLVNNHLNGN